MYAIRSYYEQHASQALVEQFRRHPLLERAHRVALYLANDGELDPRPAMDWCLSSVITSYSIHYTKLYEIAGDMTIHRVYLC